jgi:hypothetical protein
MAHPTPIRPARLAVAAAVLLPSILALAGYALTTDKVATAGDEPHYLIMADSLLTDASFDLRPAYTREAQARAIIGPVGPHMIFVDHRWMPYHTPGLSILIALPYRMGGQTAVRIFLCLTLALLPWAVFRWARLQLSDREAAWLAVGVVVCSPTCFGGSQIFPDLPAGVFATALGLWLLRRDDEDAGPVTWAAAGLAMGLLAWLNVKFAATSAVFFLGVLAVAWRAWSRGRPHAARLALVGAASCTVGPAALLGFNVWAYGSVIGGRPLHEVASPVSRAAEIFLGLHFDQSQGMFARNPLLLAGLVLLPVFFRRRPAQAAFWTLLYLSLVVPNALELSRYGGGGPTSRFAWPAMWLWAVPLVAGLAATPRLRRWLPAVTVAGLAYQAALAARWIANPDVLYPVLADSVAERDSLFPAGLRGILPSYYFWDFSSYWTYLPNLLAMAAVAVGIGVGIALARRSPVERAGDPGPALHA